ncbi:hypothetical protein PG988_006501 [Apiospora saccharicola]
MLFLLIIASAVASAAAPAPFDPRCPVTFAGIPYVPILVQANVDAEQTDSQKLLIPIVGSCNYEDTPEPVQAVYVLGDGVPSLITSALVGTQGFVDQDGLSLDETSVSLFEAALGLDAASAYEHVVCEVMDGTGSIRSFTGRKPLNGNTQVSSYTCLVSAKAL